MTTVPLTMSTSTTSPTQLKPHQQPPPLQLHQLIIQILHLQVEETVNSLQEGRWEEVSIRVNSALTLVMEAHFRPKINSDRAEGPN